MEHGLAHDLFAVWVFGAVVSLLINITSDDIITVAKATFNIVMWPLAILILCIKGLIEAIGFNKKKK